MGAGDHHGFERYMFKLMDRSITEARSNGSKLPPVPAWPLTDSELAARLALMMIMRDQ